MLEFTSYSQVASLAAVQPNAGLLVDVLHLSRSGETTAELATVPRGLVHYAHLCDAPCAIPLTVAEKRREAREARL